MIKVKFVAKDSDTGIKTVIESDVNDTWMDQLERFYEFLIGQGFIITYSSFIQQFGENVEERSKVYKE